MLGKLLKYDIKAEFKSLLPIYLVAFIMPILIRIMDLLVAQFSVLNTFYGLLLFMYVIVLIAVFVWTLIVAVKHFYNNLLKDEGYLTNTLPVKRSQIILSKEIVSLLTFIVSTMVVMISVMIGIYHGGIKEILDSIHLFLSVQFDLDFVSLFFWFIVTMLVSYVSQVQIFYLAMLLGQTRNTNKVVFSFVFGIIIYLVLQVVSLISIGIDYLIDPSLMSGLESTTTSVRQVIDTSTLVLVTSLIVEVICLVVIHYISVYVINHKLNLE
ncbi:MAG: hypothetical protein EOM50_11010 [Erysipelotrichia bacterium]|nr:hypothetical protein [Erysipelotrichia bacterium]NCC55128.1 hypothetical protein [Erysipelotrichia bacterium]